MASVGPRRKGDIQSRSLTVAVRIKRAPRAFTLIELLVVITIIGILVSILVPAVGAVRKAARSAATSAALTTIGTGLETLKADAKLGGLYPPSQSDWRPVDVPAVMSPYVNPSTQIGITGAGLLVWALSGADLLGTTGFQPVGVATTWGQCISSTYNAPPGGVSDLYALYPTTDPQAGQPVYSRSGPYVDTSKLKVTRREVPGDAGGGFAIPEEYRYTSITRQYPMYLDAFGYPILYWRADPAGKGLADNVNVPLIGNTRGVYHFRDNSPLLTTLPPPAEPPLALSKAREAQALSWGSAGDYSTWNPAAGTPPPPGTFEGYIWDKAVQAKAWPQRADSYLLVSPGFDGRYGTADDVTNFQHNGK